MTVSVHHAGEHEAARRVDHLSGCGPGLQIRADGSDDAICHQDVARWQVAQVRVDGHDVAALYQQFSRHDLPFATSGTNGAAADWRVDLLLCWCSCLPRCGAGVPPVQDLLTRLSYRGGIRMGGVHG